MGDMCVHMCGEVMALLAKVARGVSEGPIWVEIWMM